LFLFFSSLLYLLPNDFFSPSSSFLQIMATQDNE
jgi:hypothetical protein